ncbi:LysM peptidoglycan-binding domain-containing protein [Gramella sp. AN32]|uniref:LysM peptidoglycan-binding domain-containing protein n=1 Tax=Christiangramia antarctica TaxID=2058158 RepID=A0ABW5X733_9FLAO|nr:LysM peptidoglycan-binding domain-containing protein [Gramella sp. AN32]MCM4154509.1 peptidoglycan-binding protein LysM [Gramella sp. AN32]
MKYLLIVSFLFQFFTTSANAQAYKYHTVKKGENVFRIAQEYKISEEEIYKYNPDAKNGIQVNEKLVIPVSNTTSTQTQTSSETAFVEHKVAKKETLYRLSKQYNVSIDDIKRFNKHLYSEELKTGETVKIPTGQISESSVAEAISESKPVTPTSTSSSNPSPTPSAGTQVMQTGKTREHIVLEKETRYGIARKYGMTVAELDDMNPAVEMLQPGMMIRVGTDVLKDEPVIILDDRFEFYEVKPQENLFRLSQRFGLSQDSLKELNPALKDGLKYGMILKVPVKGGNSNSGEMSYTGTEKKNTKMDLRKNINNRSAKELVVLLPYHLNKVQDDSISNYKDIIMNERVVRIALDFYSGVRMAVDDAKSMGISTNLRTFDTKQTAGEVINLINSQNFRNVNAVIGPLLQETTEAAASRLEGQNIPVINPLSNREMRGYKNLFQSRPTEEIMRYAMMDFIAANSSGKNVIIIADPKNASIKSQLSSMMPSARFADPSGNAVSEQKLASMMNSGKNWVILETDNLNLISSVTSSLNRQARNHDITLLTTSKNNAYDNDLISNNHLGKLKFHYPSVDKEYDTERTKDFIDEYEKRFGIEPNQYAVRGYDLTLDVLLRLASANNLYESFEAFPGYTEYYESKFHYLPNAEGGYINDALYILKLNEDLTISNADDF